MDTGSLVWSYAAAVTVAAVVTAAFSGAIDRVLYKLIPEEVAPSWTQFVKFALFVASFAGGMPTGPGGAFIDRNGPLVTPPVEGTGLMMVMRSVGGALAGASWILLVFFGVTLTAYMAGRVWYALKERREKEAADLKIREDERRAEKAERDAASEKRRDEPAERAPSQEKTDPAPIRRQEPSEARPVAPRTESKNIPAKRP